ncbi:MAG: DnaJ domain-containing protein [FCB group bacterium]|jgi:DnaJ-domain-containing protein 1
MGQLFNRVIRFTKSYFYDAENNQRVNFQETSDAELKKIFEDLKKEQHTNHNSNSREFKNPDQSFEINFSIACKILSVSTEASIDEFKSAYLKMVKEYHPDKVANLGEEIRILAKRKTQEINQAYDIIRKTKDF